MIIEQWAARWGINPDAIDDLKLRIGLEPFEAPRAAGAPDSESAAQALVQLEASHARIRLWRNNNGATYTPEGKMVRYGLANVSKAVNKRIKSSDLIGIRPLHIEQRHVGTVVGQFIAREMKRPGWHYTGTDREVAQLKFLNLVLSMGGDAAFATGPGTL